jgi:hypothetical protein
MMVYLPDSHQLRYARGRCRKRAVEVPSFQKERLVGAVGMELTALGATLIQKWPSRQISLELQFFMELQVRSKPSAEPSFLFKKPASQRFGPSELHEFHTLEEINICAATELKQFPIGNALPLQLCL